MVCMGFVITHATIVRYFCSSHHTASSLVYTVAEKNVVFVMGGVRDSTEVVSLVGESLNQAENLNAVVRICLNTKDGQSGGNEK